MTNKWQTAPDDWNKFLNFTTRFLSGGGRGTEGRFAGKGVRKVDVDLGHVEEELEDLEYHPTLRQGPYKHLFQ